MPTRLFSLPFAAISPYSGPMLFSRVPSQAHYPWRQQLLCLAPLGILIVWLALDIGSGNTLTRYFIGKRQQFPEATSLMQFLTNWIPYLLYAVFGLFLLKSLSARAHATTRNICVFVLVQLGITIFLVQTVKFLVGSPRPLPALEGAGFSPFCLSSDFHSFPSGHTAETTGAASVLAILVRRSPFSLCMGIVIALVGFFRVYLSRHGLSDLAAGAFFGTLASSLTFYLCSREPS